MDSLTYTGARDYWFDGPPRFWPGAISVAQVLLNPLVDALDCAGVGLQRRLRRERRRRLVGRSYDMAAEIARVLPQGASNGPLAATRCSRWPSRLNSST